MVVVFPIAIGSQPIFLIIVFMSRNSVMSGNLLDMLCIVGFLAQRFRWRGRRGAHVDQFRQQTGYISELSRLEKEYCRAYNC